MCFENARKLNVYPMSAIVKIDDTPVGIEAGRNAGMWTVGITESGNEVGLSLEQLNELSASQRSEKIKQAKIHMKQSGAHFVIPSIAQLPDVLKMIEESLAEGKQP